MGFGEGLEGNQEEGQEEMKVQENINHIVDHIYNVEKLYSQSCEHNAVLLKVCATVKNDLERGLKNPKNLLDNVYKLIDMCREVTPHYAIDQNRTVVDPPLTEDEKEIYRNKVKIESLV